MFYYIYSLLYSLRLLYIIFNFIFCCFFNLFAGSLEFWCLVTLTFLFTVLRAKTYRKKPAQEDRLFIRQSTREKATAKLQHKEDIN